MAEAARLHQVLYAKKVVATDFTMGNLGAQWQALAAGTITPELEDILHELIELAPVATTLLSFLGTAANVAAAQQANQKAGKGSRAYRVDPVD